MKNRNRYDPTLRDIVRAIKKLHVANGDILLVKKGTSLAQGDDLDSLLTAGKQMGLDNVLVVLVDDFDDLTVLNEQGMANHGWFRAGALKRVLPVRPDADNNKQKETDE